MKRNWLSIFNYLSILLICAIYPVSAQEIIYLKNPSFEDTPASSTHIRRWYDCGLIRFPLESAPDIHPLPWNEYGVTTKPHEKQTYLGLVTRNNNSHESVSQLLSTPLLACKCYSFSLFMCRDRNYRSVTRKTGKMEMFNTPAVLRIWGGHSKCDNLQLIAESPPISKTDWVKYEFIFKPTQDIKSITLEAYYHEQAKEPYNGHILIDGMSPIIMIPCQ